MDFPLVDPKRKPISSAAKPKPKAKTTKAKATKAKTKPRQADLNHPHSAYKWGPSYNKFVRMNEVHIWRRKPKEI